MQSSENVEGVVSPEISAEATASDKGFSPADIKRNMTLIILLDAIFVMGFSELAVVQIPFLVYLKASNFMIGKITGTMMLGLLGVFLSPWISRRFRYKKWYMFIVHIPYLGALGILGLGVLLSKKLGITDPSLLTFAFIMMMAHTFFAGFVSVPHQEYVAACIPMSHRGRYSGFSMTVGGALAMASTALGYVILDQVSKPMAFGWLFMMTWAVAQSGYILSLFAREKPTPIEKSPQPWSKAMLKAAWDDKGFMRCVVLMSLTWILFVPFQVFIGAYGMKVLKMAPATAGIIGFIMAGTRVGGASIIGVLTDRLTPKRALPYFMPLAAMSLIMPVLVRNQFGVYISVGILSLFLAAILGAFNAIIYGLPKPEHRAGCFAVQLLFFYLSGTAGPLLIGYLCDLMPFRTVFILFTGLALAFYPFSKYMLSVLSDDLKSYS